MSKNKFYKAILKKKIAAKHKGGCVSETGSQ